MGRSGGHLPLHPRQDGDNQFFTFASASLQNASSLRLLSAGLSYTQGQGFFQGHQPSVSPPLRGMCMSMSREHALAPRANAHLGGSLQTKGQDIP